MSEKAKEYGAPTKSNDFVGRGGATERVDFGGSAAEGAERSQRRRVPKFRFESEVEKLQKSKLRMEKSGEDLERAREKLAGQKPVKPPGPVKRITNVAKSETWAFVHGKIHQVEDENVGVEGAHKAGLPCVGVLFGYGDRAEHEACGADYIVEDMAQLRKFLLD